ncbi:beta-hydroxyacyl-(acyl-carrier-protein) dehydratase, FabA/FabZ [Flavobacterium cauense R2A-7]|uniref:3-hydroxyacyl-[acyl-carrier-protein] dehydratase n=1 Tax=Flavobacterium cauense R2A-7 TaxID=1341154 RepID=V6S0J0_9FLAO|nr:beta-hydroxyacyl-ACP dehydratase [Flavobacterium cauense]ESU19924.1 beta-hydroxyacyl-(acyl-carrier-protein) dehydratase, FabA/FabZ [Flavobacterium cauense R2A-7]KGO83730.1 3-hydroxyacyl-ACP dehydratase [Flavobacterium cauense R2A-7]TWI12344.1 3-hydroxyacyl-[acyl-carrier-protein] dehydratase [Flavobacterium cauense R2A-7]
MLLKDFYTVEKLENVSDRKYNAVVVLNNQHAIFKGHFPGNPVTPGVCMMQIIKELSQEIVGSSLFMTSSSNVKFMALINPEINPVLKLELEISGDLDSEIKVKNTTIFDETVALKLSNTYKKA